MKKKVLFVAALFTASFGMAQDLTSKKGETILPEAGDYAIGFDANPFINYFGNMLNTGANAPFSANFTNTNQAIFGKMFTDANTAYRFGVRVGSMSNKTTSMTADLSSGADASDMVENEAKTSNFNVALSLGKEMRRGNTRLQGFYGAEAILSLGTSKTENTYGNDIEDEGTTGTPTNPYTRTLDSKTGTKFGFGVRGFVGVEYFVAAKISIGAEYGWGLMLNTEGFGEATTESFDGTTDDTNTADSGVKSSKFNLDTDVNSMGNIKVMFHF
jgi:hypothetical protein